MANYPDRRPHANARAHGPMSDETRMGLILVIIALSAFGAYAALFLVGFIGDLMHKKKAPDRSGASSISAPLPVQFRRPAFARRRGRYRPG